MVVSEMVVEGHLIIQNRRPNISLEYILKNRIRTFVAGKTHEKFL